jgi:hypothetical protein
MADEQSGRSDAQVAREAAIHQIVSQLVYIGVIVAVSWAISNRDMIWRLRERARNRFARPADPHAAQVAAFRREVADISRGSDGPDTDPPAPYGPDAGRWGPR